MLPAYRHRQFHLLIDPTAEQLARLEQGASCLWVTPTPEKYGAVWQVLPQQVRSLLGSEVEQLIFDAQTEFLADSFAICSGLVIGGGSLTLLLSSALCGRSRYLTRLLGMARKASARLQCAPLPDGEGFQLTGDQLRALAAIHRCANGHRRRPLVITADRGRGKSSILGLAAAELLQQGRQRILLTGPGFDALRILFLHVARLLPEYRQQGQRLYWQKQSIEYRPVDELVRQSFKTDLLIVDEAASLPTPQLEHLLRRYSRIVFSSTIYGYEGSGQGFRLRFLPVLERQCPQWRHLEMRQPVRWAAGDPLEAFTLGALLLDADPADLREVGTALARNAGIGRLDRDELLHKRTLLYSLCGLLVSAHYRTTPQDLMNIMDDTQLELWVMRSDEQVLACLLLAAEEPLPESLHRDIVRGRRRPPGHLLSQALANRCGLEQALELRARRIVRIAVHPRLQGRGLGGRLLDQVASQLEQQGVELLGASFGATGQLVRFWRKQGFRPLRLGYRKEARSGQHSVLMVKPLASSAARLVETGAVQFDRQFPLQLAENFTALEPELAKELLRCTKPAIRPEQQMIFTLERFAGGEIPYLDSLLALHRLALYAARQGDDCATLLIMKILQHRAYSEVANAFGLAGRKQVDQALRRCTRELLEKLSS